MVQWPRCFLPVVMAVATALVPASAGAQMRFRAFDERLLRSANLMFLTDGRVETATGRSATILSESREVARAPGTLRSASRTRQCFGCMPDGNGARLAPSKTSADLAWRVRQQSGDRKRSWIGRHPVLFGAIVGFGAGFLIGYLPGDDGVFDDFSAGFNGLVLGGVGGGGGAGIGAIVGASAK